jgi:hypothetical protein
MVSRVETAENPLLDLFDGAIQEESDPEAFFGNRYIVVTPANIGQHGNAFTNN